MAAPTIATARTAYVVNGLPAMPALLSATASNATARAATPPTDKNSEPSLRRGPCVFTPLPASGNGQVLAHGRDQIAGRKRFGDVIGGAQRHPLLPLDVPAWAVSMMIGSAAQRGLARMV